MAFPTYGETLLNGITGQPESTTKRTEFDSGPAKQFKFKSRTNVRRGLSIIFTATEFTNFETWFRSAECNWGANYVDWEDPRDGTTKQARVVNGSYEYNAVNAGEGAEIKYRVDLDLEVVEG